MENTEKQEALERDDKLLVSLISLEDLMEKKAKIYSRLLMDVALAKEMDELSACHQSRKVELERLLYGKPKNEKGGSKE